MDASGLLDVWERGYALAPPLRALALLAHAHPALSRAELAALPLGRRDAWLRDLRRHLFGDALAFVSSCPACSSVVESTLDLADMPADAPASVPPALELGEYSIVFRTPTLGDLVGLPDDPERARRTLAARCIADTDRERAAKLAETLSDDALAALGAAMSAADPDAISAFELECPDCAQRWPSGLDIAGFLWREIDAWARRTVRDVHTLARAYAWSEREVLALSPTRRQMYLELCRA
ncbi:MAG TPA: hypothetical protein VGC55_13230 [Dokdonella sp.]